MSWLRGPLPQADLGHRMSTVTSALGCASAGSCSVGHLALVARIISRVHLLGAFELGSRAKRRGEAVDARQRGAEGSAGRGGTGDRPLVLAAKYSGYLLHIAPVDRASIR